MAFEIGSSNIQELLTHLMNTKLSIKNKIEEVYGQDLTDIIFEEYYRYITTSDDLNPSKNYTEVSNTISGKLFRVNEIKQFLKQTIEEKCKADLTNVVFTDYYMNIKIPDHFTLTLPDGGTADFYKGWKYRVRVLNNNQPVSNTIVKFTVNGVTYDKTTDSDGWTFLTINLNPGVYQITTESNGVKDTDKLVVKDYISVTKTANTFAQACNGSYCRSWTNLSSGNLAGNEPNNYASCNNIASSSGTYKTPMYVDCRGFNFNIPAGATIKKIKYRWVGRLTSNTSNPQFSIKFFSYVNNNGQDILSGQVSDTILKSKGTNWQTFDKEVEPLNLTPTLINNSNFAGRVEYGPNQIGNTGAIHWTYYACEILYVPPQQ